MLLSVYEFLEYRRLEDPTFRMSGHELNYVYACPVKL
jgi:hypothetical protein